MVNMKVKLGLCSLVLLVTCSGFAKSTDKKVRFPSSIQSSSSACESYEAACNEFKTIVGEACESANKIVVTDLKSYIAKADAVDEIATKFNHQIADYTVGKNRREVLKEGQQKFRQCAASLRLTGDQYSF